MKIYFSSMLLILFMGSVSLQIRGTNISKDSISKYKLDNLTKEKIKINTLNQLAYKIKSSKDSLSFNLANSALDIAKRINYSIGEASANNIIGFFYYSHKMYSKALENLLITLTLYQNKPPDSVLTYANQLCGWIFYTLKRYDRAEDYFSKSLNLSKQVNNYANIIGSEVGLGSVLNAKGKTKEALSFFVQALTLTKKRTNLNDEIWVLMNIGSLYLSNKKIEDALNFYKQACDLSDTTIQLGNGTLYTQIGHIYELKSDFTNALHYNKLALEIRRKNGLEKLVSSSLINIGHIYKNKRQLDSALFYLKSGLNTAVQLKANDFTEYGYYNLYQVYVLKKDWEKAHLALKKYVDAKEILSFEKNRNESSIMEANRIINEKEEQKVRLENQNSIQALQVKNRNLLIFLSFSLLFLMVILTAFIIKLFLQKRKEKQLVEKINYQLKDEIKEKEIENEELSKSEKHFRFLADNAADPIVLMDHTYKCLYVSPFSELVFGYTPAELLELNDFREIIHPDSQQAFRREFNSMLEYGDSTRFIYQAVKKDGSSFWAESTVNPIFDESTKGLKAMVSISRDISHKVEQEETMILATSHSEMMIKEVHHRVKNNLAILASIVSMQQKEFSDTKTISVFSDLEFRVKAMALVHEQLYKSRDIEELPIRGYLSNLIQTVSSTVGNSRIKVHQDIFDEVLEVETVLSLGLILNELLTNAYKYAFPDNKEGNIWITYKKTHREKRSPYPMRQLTVRDDGVGLPPNFTLKDKKSMGSQIINLLSQHIEAELVIDGTSGANFSLTLPTRR